MEEIILITSSGCKDCKRMKDIITEEVKARKLNVKIKEFDSETDEAIDQAIKYNITEIPGCKIGKDVICGKYFSNKDIVDLINKIGIN